MAARYASVLADDPGCSVLTLSSLGMVQRSRPAGKPASPIVAMWKDPVRGLREIPLESGAQGILLTVCSDLATRRTSDGRSLIDNTTRCFDVAVHQVRSTGEMAMEDLTLERPGQAILDVRDLSVLSGWAEAIAEASTISCQLLDQVVEAASPEGLWRSSMKITKPSQPLTKALRFLAETARTVMSLEDGEVFQRLLNFLRTDVEGEIGEVGVALRVLRSAFEQLKVRQLSLHHATTSETGS